jgi:hypothetical protein
LNGVFCASEMCFLFVDPRNCAAQDVEERL